MPARRLRGFLAALCTLAVAAAQKQPEDRQQIFREISTSLQTLQDITGLRAKKRINYDLITRDKVNQFLKDRVKEAVKPEELRAEELTLKKLGLFRRLQPGEIDRRSADRTGRRFYDYHKEAVPHGLGAIGDAAVGAGARTGHALADQNFNLERFITHAGKSDDSGLARMAVMEGQATWLMTEVLARGAGQSLATNPALLDAVSGVAESSNQFPVFNSVPLYLRETLVFPLPRGRDSRARYSERWARRRCRGVPAASGDLAADSASGEVFRRLTSDSACVPAGRIGQGYKDLAEGCSASSITHPDSAVRDGRRRLTRWRRLEGGRYALVRTARSRASCCAMCRSGIRRKRADFPFYAQALRKKWTKMEIATETDDMISGTGDDGYFIVKLAGAVVSSVEGWHHCLRVCDKLGKK